MWYIKRIYNFGYKILEDITGEIQVEMGGKY
jgi:hypothetical protein